MGSNLSLFGKRRMPNGTYGVVRGVRAISPPTRFFIRNNKIVDLVHFCNFYIFYNQ